jgi:hypothetical protein
MTSFTFLNESEVEEEVTDSGTYDTFLGGEITVDFSTGDYTYVAPSGSVTGIEEFSYTLLDRDDDPLLGTLTIDVGSAGGSLDNPGFEAFLDFWSAAGSVWAEEHPGVLEDDPDQLFAALSAGIDGSTAISTPGSDRTTYDATTLENFIDQGAIDLDTLVPGSPVINGSVLKGSFDTGTAGGGADSFDILFDWQFLTDQAIAAGGPNDIAFVVIEGQLILLANSDNQNSPLESVGSTDATLDGTTYDNSTALVENQVIDGILDSGDDGIIEIAFGVVHAGTAVSVDSALTIDNVSVVPDV